MIKRKEKDMIPEERKSTKDWYLTLICMSIPIIGFFYLVTLALTGDPISFNNSDGGYYYFIDRI